MNARFNFIIPDDLMLRVRDIAKKKGISAAAIINDLIRGNIGTPAKIDELEGRIKTLEEQMAALKQSK